MNRGLFYFAGGDNGDWRVSSMTTLIGEPLGTVARLCVTEGAAVPAHTRWFLRGVTSNERYVTRAEKLRLVQSQPALGRDEATCAALIAIRKTSSWWALSQDDRRSILEDQSAHIATGLKYLPAIARRLHHCRDLATEEPFDFITWFEFAPRDSASFDALAAALRASAEWEYVDREIDIRLARDAATD